MRRIHSLTEEDLKAKILLPYLRDLGFSTDEISLESTFSLRLGTKHHKIGGEWNEQMVRGRADILCTRGEKNLFVIEAKAPNAQLTDEDVSQGISYASLVRPIAPFVIVTNGKKTRVVDTITGQDLKGSDISRQSDFWRSDCILATEEELNLRYEALKCFVGYSKDNLKAFSLSQIDDRMQHLKGSLEQSMKKYIPELFISRRSLADEFQRFMDSKWQCFALVGEAGVGKTNSMCGLAEAMAGEHMVFFFDGARLTRPILESIKEDFNWALSPDLEAVEIMRRIETLANEVGVFVFVDAIDENPDSKFSHDLDDMVRKLKHFPKIRIVVSSKDTEWDRFVHLSGSPTNLAESLYRDVSDSNGSPVKDLAVKDKLTSTPILEPYHVRRFTDNELREMAPRYQKVFGLEGQLRATALHECRLGFMLRVVAEVYAGETVPPIINTIDVMHKYLCQKLDKCANSRVAKRLLVEIGGILVDQEQAESTPHPGLVEERQLLKQLELGVTEDLEPGLFSHYVLKRVTTDTGTDLVGFYYAPLRDFVVAIMTHGLPNRYGSEFMDLVPILMKGPVGQGALSWYCGFATEEQKSILSQSHESRALAYATEYARIIHCHFHVLKEQFDPKTQQEIGCIISTDLADSPPHFAFRPREHDDDDRVIFVKAKVDGERNPKFRELGAQRTISGGLPYLRTDPGKAAKEYVSEQLEEILKNGRLDETQNVGFAIEKIVSIAYCYPRRLDLQEHRHERWMPRTSHMFPIRLDDLQRRLGLVLAKDWFEHVESRKYMKKHHTNTIHKADLDWDSIRANAKAEVEANNVIPQLVKHQWSPPFSAAYESVMNLRDHMDEVSEPLLPQPDIPSWDVRTRLTETGGREGSTYDEAVANFSDEGLKNYLQAFLQRFLDEYRILVEVNFPDLKEQFGLFSAMPVDVWTIVRSQRRRDCLVVRFKPIQSQTDRVRIELWPEYEDSYPYELGYEDLRWAGIHEALMARHGGLQIQSGMQGLASYPANEMCVLRDWVYERIEEDLRQIGWLRR